MDLKTKKVLELEDLVEVKSSNIKAVGYNDETTYVVFNNGSIYSYPNVGRDSFDSLVKAESVGKYFGKNFRGLDKYEKLEDVELKKRDNEEAKEVERPAQ